ncbi:hypothetical protein SteCoe_20931 [Stentor coeruleus]|uniref:Cyclic nucleotide-binding domain-containing protein n=1 Tax=Stentor coeruleus TaxID=5963 RepID=A0A1R2BQJ9_9CILI|nr:hypothetical protein SteCoe_20931 [Stentor coeruleus]
MKRKEIIKSYMRLWFWIDIVATFPYSWLIEGVYDNNNASTGSTSSIYNAPKIIRIIRIVRFLRILKLLRLAKLKKILIKLEDYIASNTIASVFVMLRLLSMSFFAAHWLACMWFFIGTQDPELHPITWVTKASIQDASIYEQYITSLYWSFTTIATVGYGDITPITMEEKLFAMLTMMISSGVFAYTLGSIGALLSKQTALEKTYRETFVSVNSYMKKKNLPKDLQYRVRRYLDFIYEKKKKNKIDEKELLLLLSIPLRDEIYAHINAEIISYCKVFDNFDEYFISHLTRAIENDTYAPGDNIFEEGEMSHKIYYIIGGTIEIYHYLTSTSFAKLSSKSYFGEISFFLGTSRCASARCAEFADVLSIERRFFMSFLEKFPEANQKVREIQLKCENGDYSSLEVFCYICEELGHVSLKCKMFIINLDQEAIKEKWLKGKQNKKSLKISTNWTPKFKRKIRSVSPMRYKGFNVIGGPRSSDDLFLEDKCLSSALQNNLELICPSNPCLISTHSTFKDPIVSPKKPRYSLFL